MSDHYSTPDNWRADTPIGAIQAYIATPGFVIPFLNHPIARWVLLFAFFWLVIGFLVMKRYNRNWQILIAQCLFTLPVALLPMLGPALVTIIAAIDSVH
ncbi:MAG: hypothetical protein SGJ27_22070 [Candidatus Melainabacteria bacterium]|nr:hypothetical protein [Candidatus Melainabacteria bacterium]